MKWAFYLLVAGTLGSGVMALATAGQAAPDAVMPIVSSGAAQ